MYQYQYAKNTNIIAIKITIFFYINTIASPDQKYLPRARLRIREVSDMGGSL
jgi:hypothetical protein